MQRMRTLLCLFVVAGLSLASKCPAGSVYVDSFGKCYTFRAGFVAFSQAEAECNAVGGNLVSVDSAFERSALTKEAASSFAAVNGIADFWIGLTKVNGKWTWTNGKPVSYNSWAAGNPTAGGGDCVAADVAAGQWRNVNCGAQKAYICAVAPNTQCSDPSTILNLPSAVQINAQDPRYQAYSNSAKYFKAAINMSADPCNNFYAYACGNYNKPISFYFADDNNAAKMAQQMEMPTYSNTSSVALAKTIMFYKSCKSTKSNYNNAIKDGKVVLNAMNSFASATGLSFSYIFNQGIAQSVSFNAQSLGKALGLLSAQGVDTLISPMVDTNWTNPSVYKFFVDQNTLTYSKSYYTPTAWPVTLPSFLKNTIALFNQYAALVKVSLDQNVLNKNVQSLLNLEKTLAQTYSTDDATRRHYMRSSNYYYVSSANAAFPFVDFSSYLQYLGRSVPGLNQYFASSSFNFIVMEPAKIAALSSAFKSFDPQLIANYFFYRLLLANSEFLPTPAGYKAERVTSEHPNVGRPRKSVRSRRDPFERFDAATASDLQKECATETLDFLQYTNARFFVDYLYPNDAAKQKIHRTAGALIGNILKSMQSMIDRLDWMDDATKVGAYEKIQDLKINIAYPPFVIDNAKLDAYYSQLSFSSSDSYFDMRAKLDRFNFFVQYKNLLGNTPVDRNDFLGPPGTVNAWYQPEMNSITFPAGILQEPYFDQDWPASVNYGAMGVVAGHELTHGFDDEGVQWNGKGKLSNWMTNSSKQGFQNMANCVVSEYDGFCPLAGTGYNPKCINGQQTQGENIADNGGIHSAWLAYRNHVALNGPDPQLPDPTLQWFTHDQLFFLSFAQVWCQAPPSAAAFYRQIMVDPHSPSIYRVFGTIQNFPAFRNAYNCPVGTNYGPQKFCPVWVPAQNP